MIELNIINNLLLKVNYNKYREYIMKRFYDKIDIKSETECWNWRACKLNGYGQFKVSGKTTSAHRYMYELVKGRIPKGIHVLHTCDNPSCVNPNHLFLGTHKENMEDKVRKGRMVDISGEKCGTSKLKETDILIIRELSEKGYSGVMLSTLFLVTPGAINQILNRRTWRHI